jgi:hypothetical protein
MFLIYGSTPKKKTLGIHIITNVSLGNSPATAAQFL